MKNIQVYHAEKYSTSAYTKVEENIYKGKNPYGIGADEMYFTSLTFEQEPELGEGETPKDISQYPLEGILDMFDACVTDFYEGLNAKSEQTCYQEFGAFSQEDIRKLLGIVGKHVYEKKFHDEWSAEEQAEYQGMSEEELEEEGIIWYHTVVE